MQAKKFKNYADLDGKPGSYTIVEGSKGKTVFMYLPCGHGFCPDNQWQEKDIEDEAKITLTPSIFCSPQVPCWHGFLTNGEFINA